MQLARAAALAGAVFVLGVPDFSEAFETKLYDFKITRLDGAAPVVIFDDSFADGMPPPSAPNFATGALASYLVRGSYPNGSEVGGYLQLNSAYGAVGSTPAIGGALVAVQNARLNTDTNPSTDFGFKENKAFEVDAQFDLVDPGGGNLTGYGIAFLDPMPSTVNILALNVVGGPAGPTLRFVYVDNAGIIAVDHHPDLYPLGGVALTAGGQIDLRLEKMSVNSDLIQAFYQINGGGFFEVTDTNPDVDPLIFRTTNWTQAEFRAIAAVPEPATLILLGIAGAGLGFSRRKLH